MQHHRRKLAIMGLAAALSAVIFANAAGAVTQTPQYANNVGAMTCNYSWSSATATTAIRCPYGGSDVDKLRMLDTLNNTKTAQCAQTPGGLLCSFGDTVGRDIFGAESSHAVVSNIYPVTSCSNCTLNLGAQWGCTGGGNCAAFPLSWSFSRTSVYPPAGFSSLSCYSADTGCQQAGGGGTTTTAPATTTTLPLGGACANATLTDAEIAYLVIQEHVPTSYQAYAVAAAIGESGGHVSALNINTDTHQTHDAGLWQINTYYHPQYDETRLRNDPFYNADAMIQISAGGTSWSAWGGLNYPGHTQYLSRGAAAIANPASSISCYAGGTVSGAGAGGSGNTSGGGAAGGANGADCGSWYDFDVACWIGAAMQWAFVPSTSSISDMWSGLSTALQTHAPTSYAWEVLDSGWTAITNLHASMSSNRSACMSLVGDSTTLPGGISMCPTTDLSGFSTWRTALGVLVYVFFSLGLVERTIRLLGK